MEPLSYPSEPLSNTRRQDTPPQRPQPNIPPNLRAPQRCRRQTRAFAEIRHYQKIVELLIPQSPFARFVKEELQSYCVGLHIQGISIEALQESVEVYLISMLEESNLCAIHAKRVTIQPKDMQLARRIRGNNP
ncbi:hypothetical protein KP509_1Z181900 [Ceratopteris richardii]|nr:hypothetical protein KP509_1Z181900 [Ceratopteris richardii]